MKKPKTRKTRNKIKVTIRKKVVMRWHSNNQMKWKLQRLVRTQMKVRDKMAIISLFCKKIERMQIRLVK